MSANPKASAGAHDVPSPCISVCVLDAGNRFCTGCFRTLDEIASWGHLAPTDKLAIVAALAARRATWKAP